MNSEQFKSFLKTFALQDVFVIDALISKNDYFPIDLSHANKDLQSFDISSSKAWETYITTYLKKNNKKVAFGGYLEKRNIYNRSDYFNTPNPETERNIHLGLDLWVSVNTKILAAFRGRVHSFKDNTNFGDYGPTLILEHDIQDLKFYTLYGHLSRESLTNLKVGDKVEQGEIIGYLGNATVNGDYAPHLHFQIIKNLQGKQGDYPGVCSALDLEFYRENTVNPEIILNL